MANRTPHRPLYILLITLVITGLLTGCAGQGSASSMSSGPAPYPTDPDRPGFIKITQDGQDYWMPADPSAGRAPTDAPPPTQTSAPPRTNVQPSAPKRPSVWLDPVLPAQFIEQLHLPAGWQKTSDEQGSTLSIKLIQDGENTAGDEHLKASWTYALTAPFPTTVDGVSQRAIAQTWAGKLNMAPGGQPLLLSAETYAVLKKMWGPASQKGIKIVEEADLLETAWAAPSSWAILPFEKIEPRWKVLRVDGQSPLDPALDLTQYPLAFPITARVRESVRESGPEEAQEYLADLLPLPTNRDPQKMTTLVMTGVTALSRHIAEQMESQGVTYPASKIHDWLAEADLTHISNEVSFYADCPKPGPERADMRFCSNPKYIELLEYIGADIIELTGNHNRDWGPQPFLDTLEMYRQRGWGTYGGGATLEESNKPLYVEHHGNKLVFLGCSPAGPEDVWATEYMPGSAPCNLYKLEAQIRTLREQGYLPVVTLQAVETDVYLPPPAQGTPDFRRLAKAGAIIVSGSQSHVPQTMTFVAAQDGSDSFVHYGLGNLFFDQVEPKESRQQFIDRHVIYDGRYLGVELLTAVLEDNLRPRPMTAAEREEFLGAIFSLSQWDEP